MSEKRPLFGKAEPQFGAMMAGVWCESHDQARILQRAIEIGMREVAGRPEETFLAKCFNDLERIRARAKAENWTGWGDPAGRAAISREDGER